MENMLPLTVHYSACLVHLPPSFFCTMNTALDDRKSYLESGLQSLKKSQLHKSVTDIHLHLSVKLSEVYVGLCYAVMLNGIRQCPHTGRPKYLSISIRGR